MLPSILFLLTACGGPPTQLEAISIHGAEFASDAETVSGVLAVNPEGGDQDFRLTLDGVDPLDFFFHSPSGSPIEQLDGVTVSISSSWNFYPNLQIADEEGPLYIADGGAPLRTVQDLFGYEVIAEGEVVETYRSDGNVWSFRSIDVHSDDGIVSLLPGQVEYLSIGGAIWRVAGVAAYDYEVIRLERLGATSMCAEFPVFSYEMLRVSDKAAPEFRERASDWPLAVTGCDALAPPVD